MQHGHGCFGLYGLEHATDIGGRTGPAVALGRVEQCSEFDGVGLVWLERGPVAEDGTLTGVLVTPLAPLVLEDQCLIHSTRVSPGPVQRHARGDPLLVAA